MILWSSRGSCLLREGWDSWKVENVLEEAEKRTISYFSFHSSGCSRSNPGTSVFWKRPFCISETDANERVLPGMKECKGIAALLGWALLRILFIGSNSCSPLRCVWCICLANNIPRFRSQIHSWFAAVIVLSIFSLFIPLLLYLPEFYLAHGAVTLSLPPFAILSAHENRMTRAKTSRGRSSRSMSFLEDGCTLRVIWRARGEKRARTMDTYVAGTSYVYSPSWIDFGNANNNSCVSSKLFKCLKFLYSTTRLSMDNRKEK